MRTVTIDLVGPGARPDGLSRTIQGEVRIDTGDDVLDRLIVDRYRDLHDRLYDEMAARWAKPRSAGRRKAGR